ncbi:MAG: hypothetical protein P8I93_03945 [Crocinitomicaceae bacterium]|nr:hypothetical protein [Crocinitomicaceae bacterium]
MKLKTTLTFFILLFCFISSAQVDVAKQCKKAKYDAQQSRLKAKEFSNDKKLALGLYKAEFNFLLKAEGICENYSNKGLKLFLRSFSSIKKIQKDKVLTAKYTDSIISVYERANAKGIQIDSMFFGKAATWYTRSSAPDYFKADVQFQKAQTWSKFKVSDYNTQVYYKNLYNLYVKSNRTDNELKKRLISEYFRLSTVISDNKLKPNSQLFISKIFNNVVRSCEDILPELAGYLKTLPQQQDVKITSLNNFIDLLDQKKCSDSPEYEILIDTLLKVDRSVNSVLAKAKLLYAKGKNNEALNMLNEAKTLEIADSSLLEKINKKIASIKLENVRTLYNNKNYKKAYSVGKALTGRIRGEGLKIAAKSVAAMANSCGASTFDRKCNYYYAIELLKKANSSGASVAKLMEKYKNSLPSGEEKFDKGNPKKLSLSCWGVEVEIY